MWIRGAGVWFLFGRAGGTGVVFFFSSRRRHTRSYGDWSSDVCSSDLLAAHATTLLREIGWHGVAMVEFKHDRATDSYTLMEINGRFQASTALSLDAGLNLPSLVAALYGVGVASPSPTYRVGVEERW